MVKSVIGFALVCGAFAIDTTCEDDVVSALQQSALQHSSKTKQVRAHTDVHDRLADVLKQASLGASQVCLSVLEGEEAPVAGVFSSDHGVMDVQRGYVAASSGRFCADSAVVSLLQRSMGAETMGGMERALSQKKSVDGTTEGKGKPSPKPSPSPSPTPAGPSPTPAGPSPTPAGPSPTPAGTWRTSLATCNNPYPTIYCGGTNQYGCTEAEVKKICGSLANACCDDADKSCADGDDDVKCIKDPNADMHGGGGGGGAADKDYGDLPKCSNPVVGIHCGGVNQYGCTEAKIIKNCGSFANACCDDEDDSCADGDDNVKCIEDPHAGMGGHGGGAVEANDYGSLQNCAGEKLVDFGGGNEKLCSGTNQYGCTLELINAQCGGVLKACCNDPDGSCEDGDDTVSCRKDFVR